MARDDDRLRGLSLGIVRQMRELRRARGWTVAEFARRLTAAGLGWDRARVTAIENGRRAALSIEEILIIARVLDVAPLHLIIPIDAGTVSVGPDTVDAATVRAWFVGDDASLSDDPGSSWWWRHRPPVKTGTATARAVAGGRKIVEKGTP